MYKYLDGDDHDGDDNDDDDGEEDHDHGMTRMMRIHEDHNDEEGDDQ